MPQDVCGKDGDDDGRKHRQPGRIQSVRNIKTETPMQKIRQSLAGAGLTAVNTSRWPLEPARNCTSSHHSEMAVVFAFYKRKIILSAIRSFGGTA